MAKKRNNLTAEERADLRDLEKQWENYIDPFCTSQPQNTDNQCSGASTTGDDRSYFDTDHNLTAPYNPPT